MITLFIIGIMVLVFKISMMAIEAAWSITSVVLSLVLMPVIIMGLFVAGLVYAAVPVLVVALIAAFVWPAIKKL